MTGLDLVIISGRSGSGKTTALQLLEDSGYTCVDNLPMPLLPSLVEQLASAPGQLQFAVGIDARNLGGNLSAFPHIHGKLVAAGVDLRVIYLDARDNILIKRFSETRRRHPLTDASTDLTEALAREAEILKPVARMADLSFDTSSLTLHELRSVMRAQVVKEFGQDRGLAVRFLSFGYKYGTPVDADFIFDVRCLPNPYWQGELRSKPGTHADVRAFLAAEPQVNAMQRDIIDFLERWLPQFEHSNRSYLTVAIGCTGGMHRSVYLSDELGAHFKQNRREVQVRHRQLQPLP